MRLLQPANGYRSAIDPLLLTYFATKGRRSPNALDMGAGCGIIGISLLLTQHVETVTAIEVQPELHDLAKGNSRLNRIEAQYKPILGDIRHMDLSSKFGLILMNPPFWPKNHRLPEHPQKQIACHEMCGNLSDWLSFAAKVISPRKGRLCLVYPASRLNTLYHALNRHHFSVKTIQLVYPFTNRPAELVLLEARPRVDTHVEIQPPIFLKELDGTDSEMAVKIANGQFSSNLAELPDVRKTVD